VRARFDGIGRLFGQAAQARLAQAHVCVIGIGGVGSWTAEALARSGVGALTLVDLDDVCVSNVNRQLHALDGTVGQPKVEVMAERIRRIHPDCDVHTQLRFFTAKTAEDLLQPAYDVVIDAIDSPKNKVEIILGCRARALPIVVVGGAGGRQDPTQVMHADLAQSVQDGLLRKVRQILRREHGFDGEDWGVPSVFSRERPYYPQPDGSVLQLAPKAAKRITCETGYGTAAFVTGTYGFVAAARAVELILAAS
jgi:tRNA A37 threonylcarbamoyladenosine dehydratase